MSLPVSSLGKCPKDTSLPVSSLGKKPKDNLVVNKNDRFVQKTVKKR